jgi:iron complex outermembrane recepter protein
MMRRLRLTTCAYGTAGSVLTIALMSTPAVAQEAPSQATVPAVSTPDAAQKPSQKSELGDIVVTARRTDERLQNVPVAVTALSQDRLIEANIVQSSDLQRVAPSLTVSTTIRGSDTPQYGIRAQRAGTPTMLIDPAVGVYFADVGTSRSGGGDAVLFDLASVQVLRGPQGTLFGRNTTGGAVLINPKLPTDRFEGFGTSKARSISRWRTIWRCAPQ